MSDADSKPPRDRLEEVRVAARRSAKRARAAEQQLDALRRQAALWRAGIKPGPAAELFLTHLPDDLNLADVEAVRRACAEITAAVLDGRNQLADVSP